MKMSHLYIFLPGLLLLGCSGGSSTSNKFEVLTNKVEYHVVDGMKKDVVLRSNRDNVTFSFVDKSQAPISEFKNGNILVFRTSEALSSKQEVTVLATDEEGKQSDPLTLTFITTSSAGTETIDILKTGINDAEEGLTRSFSLNNNGDVIDPYGNVWAEESDTKLNEIQSYQDAYYAKCEILRISNKDSNWRLPTRDEALNLIDFSKTSGSSMLDDTFSDRNQTYTWIQSDLTANDKYLVSFNNALIAKVSVFDTQQNYTSKCINAPLPTNIHLVSTDRYTEYTHDFTTGLQWSPIVEQKRLVDDINQTASEYCASYNGEAGWRVPNINELRSIVEDDIVSAFITNGTTVLISSTPYNDSNLSAKSANYAMYLVEDGTIAFGAQYVDELYGITCVKNRE